MNLDKTLSNSDASQEIWQINCSACGSEVGHTGEMDGQLDSGQFSSSSAFSHSLEQVRLENLLEEAVTLDLEELLSWAVPAEGRKVEVMSLDGGLDLETMKKERLVWRHNVVEELEENTVEEGKIYKIDAKQILTLLLS